MVYQPPSVYGGDEEDVRMNICLFSTLNTLLLFQVIYMFLLSGFSMFEKHVPIMMFGVFVFQGEFKQKSSFVV